MKLAVITDLHFTRQENLQLPERVGHFADIFLLKAVKRLNRYIKPDLVFIGGDLINDADDVDARSLLEELKQIIELIECPVIVIPGNHDPVAEQFYQVIERPAEAVDVDGVRFLPFIDEEQPGYHAVRSPEDIAKMRQLAGAFDGPVVSLQHVPLFEQGTTLSPHNYINSAGIIAAMRRSGVTLAVSGHYHTGYDVVTIDGMQSVTAPACCENPFQFMEIDIDKNGRATSTSHSLKLPDNLPPLTDFHVHTHLAYCGENMDMVKTLQIAELTGLDRVSFSEHAGQLYLSHEDYWSSAYFAKGIAGCKIENRMNDLKRLPNLLKVACVFVSLLLLVLSIMLVGFSCSEAENREEIQKRPDFVACGRGNFQGHSRGDRVAGQVVHRAVRLKNRWCASLCTF